MRTIHRLKGFSLLTTVIAIGVFGALAAGVFSLVSTNQTSRSLALQGEQAYFASRGAFQYAWGQIKRSGNPAVIPTRYFVGHSMDISRGNGRIQSTTRKGTAVDIFSVDDPAHACIYVLDSSASGALSIVGNGLAINTPTCGIRVNSSSTSALSMGNGSLNLLSLDITGSYSSSGTITTASGSINTGAAPVADPLLAYDVPSYSSCNHNWASYSGSSPTTLNPGVYCGGLRISGSASYTFNPGVYIIDGGNLDINGSPTITGSGVTFVLSGKISGTYARVTLNGSLTFTITAPTSGQWSGIAIFQDRNAPSGATNNVTGTPDLRVTGAMYFPNQTLAYVGNASSDAPCTMIVAKKLSFQGSANLNCPAGSNFAF